MGFLAALTALFSLTAAAPPAHAAATSLTVTATVTGPNSVTATGQLRSGKSTLMNGLLQIRLDGHDVTSVTTGREGKYRADIDLSNQPAGAHKIDVIFMAAGEYEATSASAAFSIGSAQPPGKLTLAADPTVAVAGQLVTITGKLASAAGIGVPGAELAFAGNGENAANSATTTSSDGSFTTVFVIPEDFKNKSLVLTGTFAGNAAAGASTAKLTISVLPDQPASEPATAAPAPSASPSLTPSAVAPDPDAVASAQATAASAATPEGGFPWFVVGLITITLFGAAVIVLLIYSDRRKSPSEVASGDFLDDFDNIETASETPEETEAEHSMPRRAAN